MEEKRNNLKPIVFSDEIMGFSKIIDMSLGKISKDITFLNEKNDKEILQLKKSIKKDTNTFNDNVATLRNSIDKINKTLIELDKTIKMIRDKRDAPKTVNNRDEIKSLKIELSEIKENIKRIETKLKMN